MSEAWVTLPEPPPLGRSGGVVSLVEGSSFAVSGRAGNMDPATEQGLFFLDTRFLSRLRLLVDGAPLEPLDVVIDEPFAATFVQRVRPQRADTPLIVLRRRYVGRGMREDLTIRNYGSEPVSVTLELLLDADFADLFEVKESHVTTRGAYLQEVRDGTFRFALDRQGRRRETRLAFTQPPQSGPARAGWRVALEPQGEWRTCMQVTLVVDDRAVEPRFRCDRPIEAALPHERLERWRQDVTVIDCDHAPLRDALTRAAEDLGVLRIFDPTNSNRAVIAAGAPWYMTLFGRDSLLTGWMALLADPELALGVLQTLARFQGDRVDPDTEEEPGRILHEVRFTDAEAATLDGGSLYYGTVDATPLFVMLLGELHRWGLAEDDVRALLPHADRALAWVEEFGDRDGDGYVEYRRSADGGLEHQGWKDSWDGTRFADGRFAEPPIALCEVQGYVYAAYLARAELAEGTGDRATAERCRDRAARLKARFNRDFWLPDRGWLALGLDAGKTPIDALASNMGHCLWTGILDADKARRVADLLLSDELFSGWGVRTLATSMAAYNPVSYHNGSVWPHDNAIVIAGLMRYGFVEHAQRVALALLDVAASGGGRLPELFSGFARSDLRLPVGYPTSCLPQAWAAAAPLLIVRSLLRFDPWMPRGRLWLAPALPRSIRRLHVARVRLAGGRTSVRVEGGSVDVAALPPGVELVQSPLTFGDGQPAGYH